MRVETTKRAAFTIFHQNALEIIAYIWSVNMYETLVFDEMLPTEAPKILGLNDAVNHLNKCTSIAELIDCFVITTTIGWGAKINRCIIFSLSRKKDKENESFSLEPLAIIGAKGEKPPTDYVKQLASELPYEEVLKNYRNKSNVSAHDISSEVLKNQINEQKPKFNVLWGHVTSKEIKEAKACLYCIIGEKLLGKREENDLEKNVICEIVVNPASSDDYYIVLADNTFIEEPATSPLYYVRFSYIYHAFKECLARLSNELTLDIIRSKSTAHELSNISKYIQGLRDKDITEASTRILLFKAAVHAQNFNQLLEISRIGNYGRENVTVEDIRDKIGYEIKILLATYPDYLKVTVQLDASLKQKVNYTLPLTVLKYIILLLCTNSVKHGFSDKGLQGITGIVIQMKYESETQIRFDYQNLPGQYAEEINKEPRSDTSNVEGSLVLINNLLKKLANNSLKINNNNPSSWGCTFTLGG